MSREFDDAITCELEVIPGLEAIAVAEVNERFRQRVEVRPSEREGQIPIWYRGDLADLLSLETVLAVYGQRWFPIPRPKGLLGNAEFTTFRSMIDAVRDLHPGDAFQTFRIAAAGEDSAIMLRLRDRIAAETGLRFAADEADLVIRLRRPLDQADGWDVLLRLSPRPLSARRWRVCNLAGALNATVAQAMVRLGRPHPDDAVANLACGSGTLLIERLAWGPARVALGCDLDDYALKCAAQNVAASGADGVVLAGWDAGALPTPAAWADVVLADLPFGQLVGSHDENTILYPRVLSEAARITVPGGLFVSITQDFRLWERLATSMAEWRLTEVVPIKIPIKNGYIHPRISVLQRQG